LCAFTLQGVKVVRRLREPNGTRERV
jgi:hypothetical protein